MIKNLILKNFQSHKESKLEFSPGVNIITGTSDSGKTAILRALRWIVTNRPSGEAFRRWGSEDNVTYACVTFTDGEFVARAKAKGENEYQSKGKTYKALGTDVPEEVSNILNINGINISRQLDAPFLLSESPGEVSQHFNRIAHLDSIDTGIKKIHSSLRTLSAQLEQEESQLLSRTEELTQYGFLEAFEIEVEVLEGLNTSLINKVNRKKKLDILLINIEGISQEITEREEILIIDQPLNAILDKISQRHGIKDNYEALLSLVKKQEKIQSEIEEETNILKAEKTVTDLLIKIGHRGTLLKAVSSIRSLLTSMDYLTTSFEDWVGKKLEFEEEFHEAMPDECPLCGRNTGGY